MQDDLSDFAGLVFGEFELSIDYLQEKPVLCFREDGELGLTGQLRLELIAGQYHA